MDWNTLLSTKRLGAENQKTSSIPEERTQFQRDYDRIIFSSPFRRMQNKTQVFPLPEHIFVHNRLTHSLEVASVGRSLGNLLAEKVVAKNPENPLIHETGTIVSAACLAHDLGNPPFGHSGESAISDFFQNGAGKEFKNLLSPAEWNDFIRFDGNANAFRILTHQFKGKRKGGFALTYPTLASIVKYPFESTLATKQKLGFFQSEKENYKKIAETLNIPKEDSEFLSFKRYPLVYLVEAADDICYQIMDLEDACKLGILSYEQVTELFLNFHDPSEDKKTLNGIKETLSRVTDKNEQISYLRAGVIGKLIYESSKAFEDNYEIIMAGEFNNSLIGSLEEPKLSAMKAVKKISFSEVYSHRSVIEIEIAGFKIIRTLLEEFTGASVNRENEYNQNILSLLPEQYHPQSDSLYHKIQSAVDFVSGA